MQADGFYNETNADNDVCSLRPHFPVPWGRVWWHRGINVGKHGRYCFRDQHGRPQDLVRRGATEVKYSDFVSSGSNFTVKVQWINGRSGNIWPGFLIFENPASNYPIRNFLGDVPAWYLLQNRGEWLDGKSVMKTMLGELLYLRDSSEGRHLVIWVDKGGSKILLQEWRRLWWSWIMRYDYCSHTPLISLSLAISSLFRP